MSAYPSVNWWPGNLRSHESIFSFLYRFCALNGTSLAQGLDYFRLKSESSALSDADIKRVASLLNEDLTVVRSVFAPSITLDHCGSYGMVSGTPYPDRVRYCEDCAARGYHSYLHETPWLSKCPFHQTELQTCSSTSIYGSLASRRAMAFKQLMTSKCLNWPSIEGQPTDKNAQDRLKLLEEWVARASKAAQKLSRGEIWRACISDFAGVTAEQMFGCLHAIAPIPSELEPLLCAPIVNWKKSVRRFPLTAKIELERVNRYFKFNDLFDFYKQVCANSLCPPPFATKCEAARKAITKRHKEDRCHWNRVDTGWYHFHWIREAPDDWSHWSHICPYGLALEELGVGWGRWQQILTRRQSFQVRKLFVDLAFTAHNAGLITFTPGADVSPAGYLDLTQQVCPCCEWVTESPLTDLLNIAAELEVNSIYQALRRWLDRIERGGHPRNRVDPFGCIRLVETDKGLSLIHWRRARVVHSGRMRNTPNRD